MPKRKADSCLEGTPKLPASRDQVAGRIRQADFIISNSFVISVPYNCCRESGETCMMDRTRRYSKYISCTRAGRICKREFYTGREWDLLRRAENKLFSDIEKNKGELDLLEPELENLQSRLAELHQQILNKQKQYQEAISRQRRLRKQIAFLKQKGFKISDHDADLLRILDEKTSSSEQSVPSTQDVQQLTATAENPDFDRMLNKIVQLSSSFWDGLDVFLLGDRSPGGTVEPAGGSPSNSQ